MSDPCPDRSLPTLLRRLDPRRSLAARAAWLIIALALAFSSAAALWVGRVARQNVLEQHVRRLALETDQWSSDLSQALGARLDAIRSVERLLDSAQPPPTALHPRALFEALRAAYPELGWTAVIDADGQVRATTDGFTLERDVQDRAWFRAALSAPWIGSLDARGSDVRTEPTRTDAFTAAAVDGAELGDLVAPLTDARGQVVGVIAAQLRWRRSPHGPQRLTDESEPYGTTQAFVLDAEDRVLIGPAALIGQPWSGVPLGAPWKLGERPQGSGLMPHFERLAGGRRVLIAREPLMLGGSASVGWQVLLSEPIERVYQRADALTAEIVSIAMVLGVATALLGVLGARQLTRRLDRLTRSVARLEVDGTGSIERPGGADEVAALAAAFDRILSDLRSERRELQSLSGELERRVAVRTAEVERLAEESRYAAIVRERLKMARDLHDTLAHSMMASLSEIRFLRRLHARDPRALPTELARAERIAHDGLNEARAAIAQIRGNAVRETGLGPALASELERLRDRSGIAGELDIDPESARFGDERAEVLLRMMQEALRNVERHSQATRVDVGLHTLGGSHLEIRIEDNGIGFDPGEVPAGHFGLVGLKEQAELIGASLTIDSAPERGTRVSIALPLSPIAF